MHTVFALLCFVVVIHWLIFPYPSGLLHWHCGNLTIAPMPAKQPWWIWINTSCEFIIKWLHNHNKAKHNKTVCIFLGIYCSLLLTASKVNIWTDILYIQYIVSTKKLKAGVLKIYTVHPKKYAHGFVVFCFVVVMQSFIMNSHEVFIHIHRGCFAGTGAIVRLPQCQWSKPDGYGKISQCITTTKHSKAKPCAYFFGYTVYMHWPSMLNSRKRFCSCSVKCQKVLEKKACY